MAMHIQNRHEFSEEVRGRLDELAGETWEYSSIEETTDDDGVVETRYVIHDAAGNELRTVVARRPAGAEASYRVEA